MQAIMDRRLVHAGLKALFALVARLDVEGSEQLYRPGPFIVACNHLTRWDPPLIYIFRPPGSQMVPVANEKWRKVWFIRWVFDSMNAVWLKNGEADRQTIREMTDRLKKGWPIGLAPEGTRSKTHQLQKAKPGVAWLARVSGVPVIPFAVWGVENIEPSLKRLRRADVHVRVGQPIEVTRDMDLQASTDQIMRAIAALLPERYRGVYALTPEQTKAASEPMPERVVDASLQKSHAE